MAQFAGIRFSAAGGSGFGCQATEELSPHMKLQIVKGTWNGFDFYYFYLEFRQDLQDYQEFFRLRRGAFRPKAALS